MSFDEQFRQGVLRHMNHDHADDALKIVRVLGGRPDAERVETVDVDPEGISFVAYGGDVSSKVTVPFAAPVSEPGEVRAAVVELSRRASGSD